MTLPFVLVASIILPLILIPTAKRLDKRNEPAAPAATPGATLASRWFLRLNLL